jgi:hypothetical protein
MFMALAVASRAQTTTQTPATQTAQDLPELDRRQTSADRQKAEDAVRAFEQAHPEVASYRIAQQELAELSRAYTRAQLQTIEAQAVYASSHPSLLRAQKREQELYKHYRAKLDELKKQSTLEAQYQILVQELERLMTIEDASTNGTARNPATQPVR